MNLPNKLTVARIIMIFLFFALANVSDEVSHAIFKNESNFNFVHLIALIIAILAGITDFLDGYLARKYDLVTTFGKLMDPLADKIFIATSFIFAVQVELMPSWIAVTVISREFLVTGLRTLAVQKNVIISADKWGKLKTFSQMFIIFIAGLSWLNFFELKKGTILGFQVENLWLIVLGGIVFITVFSGANYFYKNRNLFLDGDL